MRASFKQKAPSTGYRVNRTPANATGGAFLSPSPTPCRQQRTDFQLELTALCCLHSALVRLGMCSLKELRRVAVIVLIAWLSTDFVACAHPFTSIPVSIPGLRYGSIAWGDFDNDGDLDLLVSGDTGTGAVTRIYRNDGGGNFVDIQAGLPGISSGAAAW